MVKQGRVDKLFEAVVEALQRKRATPDESMLACASALGFFMASEEEESERFAALTCAVHVAVNTMQTTMDQADKMGDTEPCDR